MCVCVCILFQISFNLLEGGPQSRRIPSRMRRVSADGLKVTGRLGHPEENGRAQDDRQQGDPVLLVYAKHSSGVCQFGRRKTSASTIHSVHFHCCLENLLCSRHHAG